MHYTPLMLIDLQSRLLFLCGADGRLLYVNEPEGARAPRLFVGCTDEGAVWRFRDDVPERTCRRLEDFLEHHAAKQNPHGPSGLIEGLSAILAKDAPVQRVEEGPAFWLPEPTEETIPADVVHLTEKNLHLLPADFTETRKYLARRSPVVLKLIDGEVASYVISSRQSAAACEAGLMTFDAYRRRGYAVEVVRHWARILYAQGTLPLYSTSWSNTTSQGVAAKLGGVFYGSDLSLM